MQPPWIFFLLILVPVIATEDDIQTTTGPQEEQHTNTSLVRSNRGTERDQRAIQQYPTYYLAHSYTDEAGERRNVLIPVQAGQQATSPTTPQPPTTPDYRQFSPSPQITPNGLPATSNPAITHAMLVSLQNVSPTRSPDYPPGAFVYAYRKPSKNYISSQRPVKPIGYTGSKLQYKTPPTKLYNLDVGHRFRPRGRPDKNKYTATKLQYALQSTPSPYYNQVRFELADAMIPGGQSIALQPVPSTPQTTTETTTLSGLSQYLETQKPKFYYHQPEQIQYIQQQPQQMPSSEPQYIQANEVQTPRPEMHYTQSTPSPSSRPATLQQHFEDSRQTYYPESKPTPQIEYVPVTDIETAPQPTPQQYQYEGNRPTQQSPIQFIIETENVRQPPRPQVHYASDNGDLRASAQPQIDYERPSPRPHINYPSESTILRGASQFVQDTNEVTPTPQYEPETVRTTPHVQYDHEHNDVSTPQPQYQYVTEDVTPTPDAELTYAPPKFPPAVQEAYNILKQTNQLPSNITPDNIDGSIKTLALILQRLQQQEKIPKYPTKPKEVYKHPSKEQTYPPRGGTPGRPGIDYPTYATIPKTSFDCTTQRYKGFFGDPDTSCQVWHYCDLNGGQASFLCPNGTIFNQVALTCDWWFNVRCSSTSQLYVLNERLYKYILPFSPSFPEDYSGPVVDRYLAAKFKEQEAKNKIKALKAFITTPAPDISSTETTTEAEN